MIWMLAYNDKNIEPNMKLDPNVCRGKQICNKILKIKIQF
jgi:hypothetical protein